jgi:thiamine kinase-like enzyme
VLNGFVHNTKVGMQALGKVYGDVYAPIVEWMPKLRRRHRYIIQQLFKPPLTMAHGDAHIENVFFHERFPGGVCFVDFGNMMFSQGMCDVAFYVVNSLQVADRRAQEEAMVTHYHTTLVAEGVKDYTIERCRLDYVLNLWRPLISLCTIGPSLVEQKRKGTGVFSPTPSADDQRMREMYDKLRERPSGRRG